MTSAAEGDVSGTSDVSAEESKKSKDLDGEGTRPARDSAPALVTRGPSPPAEGEPKSSPAEGGSTGRDGSDGAPLDREAARSAASTGRGNGASPVGSADGAALLTGTVAGRGGTDGTSPDTRSRAGGDEASPKGGSTGRGGRSVRRGDEVSPAGEVVGRDGSGAVSPGSGSREGRGGA
ncbi:hypothetical protein [Streptomyces albiflavescens]|uniref:hypothetical protein n=1 Tax=Streptomyces albiflavescens TaxID=1623582 RepID=UPI00166BB80D|nr:hypothetical protein [Streptomyces albiflavescens]